jgi:hypothetical protein
MMFGSLARNAGFQPARPVRPLETFAISTDACCVAPLIQSCT